MDTNAIMVTLPSRPNHLPKAPFPNTITLGVRVSSCELRGGGAGGGHKHSVHNTSGPLKLEILLKGSQPLMSQLNIGLKYK